MIEEERGGGGMFGQAGCPTTRQLHAHTCAYFTPTPSHPTPIPPPPHPWSTFRRPRPTVLAPCSISRRSFAVFLRSPHAKMCPTWIGALILSVSPLSINMNPRCKHQQNHARAHTPGQKNMCHTHVRLLALIPPVPFLPLVSAVSGG